MFRKYLILIFILVSSFAVFAKNLNYNGPFCGLIYQESVLLKGERKLSEIKELRLGTYNVLNLEYSRGKYVIDEATGLKVFKEGFIKKPESELQGIAKAIKDENLDIIVLQEVEGLEPLKVLNRKYLGNAYEEVLVPGNDSRGINIAFLVKKDLPLKFKIETHKDMLWNDLTKNGVEAKLFSRDLPTLHIRKLGASDLDPPDLILMGTHFKSQRDRAGDALSKVLRKAQVDRTAEISKFYESYFGPKTKIILAGDFNGNILKGEEFLGLKESSVLQDSFDLLKNKKKITDRYTHSFHDRDGVTHYSQLDGIFISKTGKDALKDVEVYRYKDINGRVKPLPKSYEERSQNPSDHFLLRATFDFQKLFFY